MLEAWINLGFFEVKDKPLLWLQWRVPLAIPTLISIVPMVAIFAMPESPRWLCAKSRFEEARVSMAAFEGLEVDDPVISDEIAGVELALEETSSKAKLRDIFTMGKNKLFYRFSMCIFLQFAQQMCGANLISTYSTVSNTRHIQACITNNVPDYLPTGSWNECRNVSNYVRRRAHVEILSLFCCLFYD